MSAIPEELKERARWEIDIFERVSSDTSQALLERVEELEDHLNAFTSILDPEDAVIVEKQDEINEWYVQTKKLLDPNV